MHIWTCPYQTPQVSGWVRNFFQNPIYIISNKFCKKNFALKCIPGLSLIRVLPLGQGGRPPDVWVGLKIFQNATYTICNKFC